MSSRKWRNVGFGFVAFGTTFVILGIVLLSTDGSAVNYVTIGAGWFQIVNGLWIINVAKRMEIYDV